TLFVLTEPRLADHVGKLGVQITQIGGPVQHRGIRVPSMMDVDSIIRGLRFFVRPLWRVVNEEIDACYQHEAEAETVIAEC
ncbi:MAG: PEP-CTERM/exosortase system-associated acyltransferase, partial [Rhodocyclales bacterium]|nr:PEP-CTERM/exosortase system-associated acyltransferase [Rhodocyclales bacterium]